MIYEVQEDPVEWLLILPRYFRFGFFCIPQQYEAAYSLPDKETHFSHNLHLKEEPHIPKTTVPSALRPRFRLIYVLL